MFRQHTVSRVSGLFEQTFWTEQILRAAGRYPAIWHATLAVAAIQQWKSMNSPDSHTPNSHVAPSGMDYYTFALRHYANAVSELVSIAHKKDHTCEDKETILTAEILFIGINSMAGYLTQAIQHAQNLIKLCDEWDFAKQDANLAKGESSVTVLSRQSITTFVANFKIQFVNRLDHEFLMDTKNANLCKYRPLSPAPLQWTVDEAYHEMTELLFSYLLAAKSSESMQAGILPSQPMSSIAGRNLLAWTYKFQKFRQSQSEQSPKGAREEFGWRMLEIYQRIMRISLVHDDLEYTYKWDRQTLTFFGILEDLERLAEDWLTQCRARADKQAQDDFSFSMSMAESCYFISIACRDHDLRLRAIALLRRWGICDGLWDSNLMAAVIEATMDVEEEPGLTTARLQTDNHQACPCIYRKYICEEHRIWTRKIRFLGVGEASFSYSTVSSARTNKPTQVKILRY